MIVSYFGYAKLSDYFCLFNQMNSDFGETDTVFRRYGIKRRHHLKYRYFLQKTDTHQYLHFGSSHPIHV